MPASSAPSDPFHAAPLGTRAFTTLLVATVAGAFAIAAPHAAGWGATRSLLPAIGRLVGLALLTAGAAALTRSYHTLRRALAERARAEAEARAASLTDELTGVYNRRGFRALAEHQLRIARRSGGDALLLYVDVDGFKDVNDRHGHAAGDGALREIGELLRVTMRETDIVARLGGDEFVILAVDGDQAAERAVRSRLACALAARNLRATRPFPLAFTLGASHLDDDRAATLDELLDAADRALYAAKQRRYASVL